MDPSHSARQQGSDNQEHDDASEPRRITGWASAAEKRTGGQIGNGLLHNIETRLGSIA